MSGCYCLSSRSPGVRENGHLAMAITRCCRHARRVNRRLPRRLLRLLTACIGQLYCKVGLVFSAVLRAPTGLE